MSPKDRCVQTRHILAALHGQPQCPLAFQNIYQLLVATILSAQCTDKRVNELTPSLFLRYPDPASMAAADPADVSTLIRAAGLHQAKSKNLVAACALLMERFDGEVPDSMDDLLRLPGVGRKTANVILHHGFGKPGFPVDTHVLRLSNRIGFAQFKDPRNVEMAVRSFLPEEELGGFSLLLILHGRSVCPARSPRCGECPLPRICLSALDARETNGTASSQHPP